MDDVNVAPMFRCVTTFYRQHPVLVLCAHDAATRTGGRVNLFKSTLREMAIRLGFKQLDRALLPSHRSPSAIVVSGLNGVTLEVHGSSIQVEQVAMPSCDWLAAVSHVEAVHVLLVVPTEPGDPDLRKLLGAGRGFGGLVEVMSIDGSAWSTRYTFLGDRGAGLPIPQAHTVILDSSVLIDLERVASGKSNESTTHAAQGLALELVRMDAVPGGAIAELMVDVDLRPGDPQRGRSLIATMNAWFDGGISRTRRIREVQAAYARGMASDLPDVVAYESLDQLALYASLLRLALLWTQAKGCFRASQRVALFEEYLRWTTQELGISCAYAAQLARDRLVGPQNSSVAYTDKLLKFGKHPLHNLWGASWDLFHLSSIDLLQEGIVLDIGSRDALFVTADRGIVALRDRIHNLQQRIDLGHGTVPLRLGRTDLDHRLVAHETRIRELHLTTQSAIVGRDHTANPFPSPAQVRQMIHRLESELLAAL